MTMQTASKSSHAVNQTRILLVDDHPVARRGLAGMIEQEPDLTICGEAESFNEALEAMKQHEADIAIVDLTLKDIGGLELIKQLQLTNPTLIVLTLSMHDEALYAERVLRAGTKGYIMKQEGPDKLITAIRTILGGDIYVSQVMASKMLGRQAQRPGAGDLRVARTRAGHAAGRRAPLHQHQDGGVTPRTHQGKTEARQWHRTGAARDGMGHARGGGLSRT
jgi:DNA-binding NarL/FixJ family response regulator